MANNISVAINTFVIAFAIIRYANSQLPILNKSPKSWKVKSGFIGRKEGVNNTCIIKSLANQIAIAKNPTTGKIILYPFNNAGGLIVSWTKQPSQYIFASRVYANGALPLNFVDINLLPQFPDVHINWSTASETNTNYFTIQKSMDGAHFNNVTNVPASGNSNTKTNYQFKDLDALNGNVPILYYRIKETDKDGKIQYSNIKKLKWNTANTFKLVSNPVNSVANLEYFSTLNSTIKLRVVDQLGKIYISTNRNILQGINNFNLPIGNLANGVYTIQLFDSEKLFQLRMVKK